MRWGFALGICVVCAALPHIVYGAHLYLESDPAPHNSQDTFYIPVRIDTQDECINAVRVGIAYDPAVISIRDVSIGDSILTLWTESPYIERLNGEETGRVVFEGGVPGGYCGRVLGDPGLTNVLVRLVATGASGVTVPEGGMATQLLIEPQTRVFLHDGEGTEASRTVLGTMIQLVPSTTTPNNIWLNEVKEDTVAPELFEVILVEGPSAGNSRHYIVFNTVDKQSGIDHYEVLETDPDHFGLLSWISKEAHWVRTESPYVLRDQKLHSTVMVKAVDKNGNERTVTYTPPMTALERIASDMATPFAVTGLVILILATVLFKLARKRRKYENVHES